MMGQMYLFELESDYIKDIDCTKDTPITLGVRSESIYGSGTRIRPRIPGKHDTEYAKKIYLDELLPLEEYDLFVILLSGGKDSVACYYKLLELGVPKEKIEFWHHDIDGAHPSRKMDWRCTPNYVKALADAEGISLRLSYRVNGFYGELYRMGASEPIEWVEPDTGEIKRCKLSQNYLNCQKLKGKATEAIEDKLKQYGYRMKFPAKSGDLSRRWCSAYLKICVADAVVSNLEKTKVDKKILVVSGERRGESSGRAHYNEMEIHRTNAEKKAHRIVHQWRAVIDYSEKDVWEVLKRHNVNPHPCYRAGWNRCSCAMCIFSTPTLFAGIKELMPEEYKALKKDEQILGFTIDNNKNLDEFVGEAKSCVYHGDEAALYSLMTGDFKQDDIYIEGEWKYPAGAFHGAKGGPC